MLNNGMVLVKGIEMRKTRNGFTLIELLVVISIIAVLMSILMPALGKVKVQAKKILDANNLRQIGISLNLYAASNNDKFPTNYTSVWLQDIAYAMTDLVIESGGDKQTFYCPFVKEKTWEDARIWQYSQCPSTFNVQESYFDEPQDRPTREALYRITGYMWLFDSLTLNQNGRGKIEGKGNKQWVKKVACHRPAELEMVVDAIYSNGENSETCLWEVEMGGAGLYGKYLIKDRTNHMKKDKPEGGHAVYVDGHALWRDFDELEYRYTQPGNVCCWW